MNHLAAIGLLLSVGLPLAHLLQSSLEGPCWTVEPPQIKFDLSWMLEFITEAKYTPMASQLYYTYIHSLLTGDEPKSTEELDKMCLEVEAGLLLKGRGYDGKSFEMSCSVMTTSSLKCARSGYKENVTSLYLTWSQPKKYIIFATCAPPNLKAWSLMSNQQTVDDPTKTSVLEHIQKLGFDPAKALVMDYTTC